MFAPHKFKWEGWWIVLGAAVVLVLTTTIALLVK